MFNGTLRKMARLAAVLVFCLVVATATAQAGIASTKGPQAYSAVAVKHAAKKPIRHKKAKGTPAVKIIGLTAPTATPPQTTPPTPPTLTFTTATFSFKTNVAAKVSVATGIDRSNTLPKTVVRYLRGKHTVVVGGLSPNTTYWALVTATPKRGRAAHQWLQFTTVAPGSMAATPAARGASLTVNGQKWMPFIEGYLSGRCLGGSQDDEVAAIQKVATMHVSVFMPAWNCAISQPDVQTAITNAKLWATNALATADGAGENPGWQAGTVSSPSLIGWEQPLAPESSIRPEQLGSPPGNGALTFLSFSTMLWKGQAPDWQGYDSNGNPIPEPAWGPATTRAYFSHGDVLGWMNTPYRGSCGSYPASQTYDAVSSLASASGKPVVEWVRLTQLPDSCKPGPLTPLQATSQMWLGIEAGAAGIGFSTIGPYGQPYDVSQPVADAVSQAVSRLQALGPCLLTGKNLTPEVSGGGVVVRAYSYGGQIYILATNTGDKPVTAGIRVGTKAGRATVLWEGRTLKMPATGITDKFGPLQTHIYRVVFGGKK